MTPHSADFKPCFSPSTNRYPNFRSGVNARNAGIIWKLVEGFEKVRQKAGDGAKVNCDTTDDILLARWSVSLRLGYQSFSC
jgi:hypothetical protein